MHCGIRMSQSKLGIIAGLGDLPSKVVQACQNQERPYHILAFENQSDTSFVSCHPHSWLQLAKAGKTISTLKQNQITHIVMAGYFKRPEWNDLKPDLKGVKLLGKIAGKSLGDDGLLRIIIDFFESEGFVVVSPEDIMGEESLIEEGILSQKKPTQQDYVDIQRGFEVAKALGALDVGQGCVVQNGVVLGVEAFEGTNELIKRSANLANSESQMAKGVFVKVIKPQQDKRVDRSVIGPETLKQIAKSGFSGVAAEANEILMIDRQKCIEIANAHNLFLIGISFHV